MDACTQTILRFLQDSAGYDATSPYIMQLAKKLAQNEEIQHYVNTLHMELFHVLETTRPKLVRRSLVKTLKSAPGQHAEKNTLTNLPALEIKFRVPNLTAGKPFQEKIQPLQELPGVLQFYQAIDVEKIPGLSINANFSVEGMLANGGDYEVTLLCMLLHPEGTKQRVQGKLKITVIPDPRSLWKNLPSDASARFHKPDAASGSCATPSAVLMAASVRGRSHAHKGIHRDDDIRIACAETTAWNVICVADGAGSCQYSRRGAELAVTHSTQTLRETLNDHYGAELEDAYAQYAAERSDAHFRQLQSSFQHTIIKAVFKAAIAIQEEVKNNPGDTFKDYSTTLLLAAHKPVADGHLILSFWVGDGAVALYTKGEGVILCGEPDSGEYAGQTRFLDTAMFDDSSVYRRVNLQKVPTMTALILATDGITDAKFATEKQLSDLAPWDALWSELEPFVHNEDLKQGEKDLIQWMDFWSPGNHDDRSIALCTIKE